MGRSLSKFSNKNSIIEPARNVTEQRTMIEAEPVSTQLSDENQTSLPSSREFHTNDTSTYWLPKDDEEQLRLAGVSSYCRNMLTL
jgi:hypothetical protein